MKFMTLAATFVVGMLAANTVLASDSSFLEQRSARFHQATNEGGMRQVDTVAPMALGSSYWEQRSASLRNTTSEGVANQQADKPSARVIMSLGGSDPWWR